MSEGDERRLQLELVTRFLRDVPAGCGTLETFFQKLVTEAAQAAPPDRAMPWLARQADARIRELADQFDVVLRNPNGTLTIFQAKTYAPVPVVAGAGLATATGAAMKVTTVPLPADTIGTREVRHHGVNYANARIVLLAVLAWLIYFVLPQMISKLPSADQVTPTDYCSAIPAVAVALTGYLLTNRKLK
jgi:hypothetical protein